MTIYQITHRRTHDEHDGYSYETNRKAALTAQSKANKFHKQEGFVYKDKIAELKIQVSKEGILQALNQFASHPDNG